MSASGTDHTSGTSAKMSRPSPGPTEWMSVSVVYGPPEVEKKRTKTSPSVPIPRGSFCFIDHARTHLANRKWVRQALADGWQGATKEEDSPWRERWKLFRIHRRSKRPQKVCFILSYTTPPVLVVIGRPQHCVDREPL